MSKPIIAFASLAFLVASATARADVAPPPTGGHTSVSTGGSASTTGGSSSVAGAGTTTTAGSSGVAAPNDDDGGCSIGKPHHASAIALGVLGVALAFGLRRARRH